MKSTKRIAALLCAAFMLVSVIVVLVRSVAPTDAWYCEYTSSDGSTYRITVSCGFDSGIPEDSVLTVKELKVGDAGYDDYMASALNVLGFEHSEELLTRAFDISIRDPETYREYQPEYGAKVTIELLNGNLDEYDDFGLVHIHNRYDALPDILEADVSENTVDFFTQSFSVFLMAASGMRSGPGENPGYVVLKHEQGEVITPRVQFHFLSQVFEEDAGAPGTYSAGSFEFINKGGTYQTSEILKDGESLELIMNPPNIEIDDGYGNITGKYFFGWYLVEASSVAADGKVSYQWTADPEQLTFEKQITIDPDKIVWADADHTAISSITWELNGVEHTALASDNTENRAVIDEYACVHVYVAPIYQDYYFINFHAGKQDTDLGNSIITRRLVVLGNDGLSEVRIGDVQTSSSDAQKSIFTGWEGNLWSDTDGAVVLQEMKTLDEVGEELNSGADKDGFYITVGSHDLYPGKMSVDLYPIFTEARWFHFRTGRTGNGATYVGDTYVYTTDEPASVESGRAPYYVTDFPAPARTGYSFKGWYANAEETDSFGDFIDGNQITDENGRVINAAYTKYDGVTPLYQMKNGRLYVYKDVDAAAGVVLYAHWEEITETKIQVIIWRQKVGDSKNAYDHEKTYDFEASYTVDSHSGLTLSDLRANNALQNYENAARYVANVDGTADFTGFHYRTTVMNTAAVRGDGSTVVNVYYDRDLMTIYYYYNSSSGEPAYTYTETTGNTTPQFGIVEGKYVELVRKQGSGMKYTFRYAYQQTTSDTITPQYALVSYTGGVKLYEELTRDVNTVTNTRWMFKTGSGFRKTTRYMDQGVTDGIFYVRSGRHYVASDYTENDPPQDNGTTYYCYYNYRYYELTPQSTTTTTYAWKLNGASYTGARYLRLSGSEEYTGERYTVSGHDGETFGVDSRGGYVELNGTAVNAYQWFTTTHVEDYFLDNNNNGTQQDVYGLVDGEYVKLTPSFGDTYTYKTANTYTPSDDAGALWGLVDGEYVQLTKHGNYSYNRTGYTYTYTTSNSGTQYGIVNGKIQRVYRNNSQWRLTDERNGTRYNGYRYTSSSSNSNAYNGQLYVLIDGTAGSNESGFTQTDAETGDNLYGVEYTTDWWGNIDSYVAFQLRVTDNSYYTYKDGSGADRTYTGTRYALGAGADWTGDRYTRSGDAAPYAYSAHTGNPAAGTKLYIVDGNGGHVVLNWSVNVSGYTYEDANGTAQSYSGDRYSFLSGEIETEYTGTRFTRATQSGYTRMLTYTGLYGQTLSQAGYTWPDKIGTQNYIWYSGRNSSGSRLTFLDAFLFAGLEYATNNNTVLPLYGTATTQSGTYIYFYKQNLDGTYPATGLANAANAIGTTSGGRFTFTNKYTGFELDTYSTNNGSSWSTANVNGTATIASTGLHIRFRRQNYELVFEPNYPTKAGTTIGGVSLTLDNIDSFTQANRVTLQVPYDAAISGYSGQPQPAQGPDNYSFTGWYVDSGCTVPYNFNENMPAANMRLYAGWTPVRFRIKIDPNGGEIDHINHKWDNTSTDVSLRGYADSGAAWWWVDNGDGTKTARQYSAADYNPATWTPFANFNRSEILAEDGTVERAADTGWAATSRYSTYINAYYMASITEYTNIKCEYIPVSDAFAATYNGTIYYYMNAQFQNDAIDGSGIPSANRSALYLTESELHEYYLFYKDWVNANLVGGYIHGTTILDEEAWRETYVSKQKYRHTIGTEKYTFLGWYKLDSNGNPETMPYNFSDPVTEGFTLKAYWRLDAGYQIRYHADYTMDDGTIINGTIPYWTDPEIQTSKYADEAATHIYRQPTGITENNIPTTEYIFRGWRLVNLITNAQGQVVYQPIENEVYYDPGDDFTVHAAYADKASVIHMQAVYEYKDSAYRRPYVTNLTLDANGGFITLDGENELGVNTDITAGTWNGKIGKVEATVKDVNGADTERIRFIKIQSGEKIQLYRYATDLTHVDGDDSKPALDPAGKNYFKHRDGYLLLGFDEISNEGDYVADYPADSVVAVPRNKDRTIYAVWEPMVYIKVVNSTGVGDVTFSLSSAEGALQVVNARNGLYERTPMSAAEMSAITVADGDYVWLAVPYGVIKETVGGNTVITKRHITIEGTNNLGTGYLLSATSELNGTARSTLTGSISGTNADYTGVQNLKDFGFNEELEIDPEGIVITFTAVQNPHTLVLDDNYPTVGVRTQEVYFDKKDNASSSYGYNIVYGQDQTLYYELPTTSTRIGYIFLGWDPDPDWMAGHPDYKTTGEKPAYTTGSAAGWTISSLDSFFDVGATELAPIRTLYAVWDNSADAKIVNVYKEVPEPGDVNKEFTFTVALSGKYDYTYRQYSSNYTSTNNNFTASGNGTFTLKHGEYLRLESAKVDSGSGTWRPVITTTIRKYNAEGTLQSESELKWQWNNEVSSSGTYRSFAFHDLNYSVTETDYSTAPHYYDTAMSCTAQASDTYPLKLGDTTVNTASLPAENGEARVLTWTDTEAGGTVVFTNTRQTADVTVKKVLVSNSAVPGVFNYTASYVLDGITTDLGRFTVTSGTEGHKLESLPVGAAFTVTETGANLDDYNTTAKLGTNDAAVIESTDSSSGTTVYNRSVNYTVAKGGTTIEYTNTLKSYPITFYMVDQDGEAGVPSFFSIASSTGLIADQLYPLQTGTGEFFPNNTTGVSNAFYVGTYTLTETFIGDNFLPLDRPVTLTLSPDGGGKLVSSNSDYVKVEKVDASDPTRGFKVTVYAQKTVKINITKVLSDPLLSGTRAFNFHIQYVYELLGRTVTYDNMNSLLSVRSGGSEMIKVPVNAKLTVTENLNAADKAAYDTSIQWTNKDGDNLGEPVTEGTEYVYSDEPGSKHYRVLAESDGDTLTFTNKRKTVDITVKKVVEEGVATGTFDFEAFLGNGRIPIKDYPIVSGGSTDADGKHTFALQADSSVKLTVPIGARLELTETGVTGAVVEGSAVDIDYYSTTAAAVYDENSNAYDGASSFNSEQRKFAITSAPKKALTITFTNGDAGKVVMFMKTDGFGNALGGAVFRLYKEYGCTTNVLVNVDGRTDKVDSVTSDAAFADRNGTVYNVSFKVSSGVYYMKETNAPAGYKNNASVYRVVVGNVSGITLPAGADYLIQRMDDESTVDGEIDIARSGIINVSDLERMAIIRKINQSCKPLPGAKFDLHAADLSKLELTADNIDTSNQYGAVFVGMLPYGKYYLHETAVPDGYQALATNDNWFEFVVDENGVSTPKRLDAKP